jgi:hypothetical protein
MKNLYKVKAIRRIAGIIALVAVIGFSMAACADDSGGSSALNGDWTDGYFVFAISGSNGRFSRIPSSSGWYNSYNRGYVNIGDQYLRNIRRTSDSSYSADILLYNTSTYRVSYYDCTITLASNGRSFNVYSYDMTPRNVTFTRYY